MLVNNQNPEGFVLSKHRAVDVAVQRGCPGVDALLITPLPELGAVLAEAPSEGLKALASGLGLAGALLWNAGCGTWSGFASVPWGKTPV